MDIAIPSALRSTSDANADVMSGLPEARALTVKASFLLSEEGRKASLLEGGNGRTLQEIVVSIPANRLHLVSVDAQGGAHLKLRPRFELDDQRRIVRVDAPPTYDRPPAIEDLFRAAALNLEFERGYVAEQSAARAKRREAERERRDQVAVAFIADVSRRAVPHPPPTPKRCCVMTDSGRMYFDVATDAGAAQKVPLEAHHRFRADLRARRERALQERAAQLAVHEEKKRFVAAWISAHGTEEQRARSAAGMLPMDEAIEAITQAEFAVLGLRPVYVRDGAARLQALLRRLPGRAEAIVTNGDLLVTSVNAVKATPAQWQLSQELRSSVPDATVTLRLHKVTLRADRAVPVLIIFGVLVTRKCGPLTLRREYIAPGE